MAFQESIAGAARTQTDPSPDATPGAARARDLTPPAGGVTLVLGSAGAGRSQLLRERLHALMASGVAAERVLVLAPTAAGARRLRARLEAELTRPYAELSVHDASGYCERLLRSEPLQTGLDPFFVAASRADRVAMLAQRVDELALVRHDFMGRPTALMASIVARIDRLKEQLLDAAGCAAEADARLRDAADGDPALLDQAQLDAEFARVYLAHDRMLAQQGTLDRGELVARACALLQGSAQAGRRAAERHPQVLVDDLQDLTPGALRIVTLLARAGSRVLATADEQQAIARRHGVTPGNVAALLAEHPGANVVQLPGGHRCPPPVLAAARAVLQPGADAPPADDDGTVRFWRAATERAQAQAVAADVERLLARHGVPGQEIAILVRSVRREGRAIAAALSERAIPHRVIGAADLFDRPQVRDVLAWMRLLSDPRDAAAVSRALVRPPIELRSVDLARVVAIARRRHLDMVSAVAAAIESPQTAPQARERLQAFLRLHRGAEHALDATRPDMFVGRLIDRLGLRRQQLFAAHGEAAAQLLALARLGEVVAAFCGRAPQATPRELATYLNAVADAGLEEEERGAPPPSEVRVMTMAEAQGREFHHVYVLGLHAARMPGASVTDTMRDPRAARMRRLLYLAMTRASRRLVLAFAAAGPDGAAQPPSPFVLAAMAAVGGRFDERAEELFGPAEALHGTLALLREEVLGDVARIAGRLSELRLDTDLDVAHGVVRYLELIKLAALIDRPPGEDVAGALADINQRLAVACTPLQRDALRSSPLDGLLAAAALDQRARAQAIAARDEPSLEAFLPRQGDGLLLSASDLETYRACPLRYKFARVFRIPAPPTLNQRFGILVHQVLERYHALAEGGVGALHDLLAAGWRRGGFGDSREERQLYEKARAALVAYHGRLEREPVEPLWFERRFTFRVGPHRLRGRVDRVDRVAGDGYELIDYKTGRPRTVAQLQDDIQLSLYAVAAREAWQLEASTQSYYYLLDDCKVTVPRRGPDERRIADTVTELAEGILSQDFEPTPSYAACSACDYRIVCPAAAS